MDDLTIHQWAQARLLPFRAGLLDEPEAERLAAHLRSCEICRASSEAFEAPFASEPGAHLPPSLIAEWPRARRTLRGLERALARHHLERCAECRQDLELLGYESRLEQDRELETVVDLTPHAAALEVATGRHGAPRPPAIVRIVQAGPRLATRRWHERALQAWATLATAAAVLAAVLYVRRPVVEGVSDPLMVTLSPPDVESGRPLEGEPSLRLAPRPRSLSGPTHGPRGGKVTVIPVVGPVRSLALTVRPLDVPDTSWVSISLVAGDGDTLFSVRHRQWEFFPKRVLMIDGEDSPLRPGKYALVLASLIGGDGSQSHQMSRYLFELRRHQP